LTPYLTRKAIGGMRDGRTILAWQIAAFTRQKKLPKLDELLKSETPYASVADKMRDLFSQHNHKGG